MYFSRSSLFHEAIVSSIYILFIFSVLLCAHRSPLSLSYFQGASGFASAPPEEVIFPPGK